MPQLFSRSADRVLRGALIAGLATAAGLPLALIAWTHTPSATGQFRPVPQPIAFSHPVHVTGLGIECRYCHASVERSSTAGLPPTVACVGCHTSAWLQSAAFEPVRRSLRTRRPIPWRRVTSLPEFVYFDHSAHTLNGVACASCHGHVERMQQVHQHASLTMNWCVDCHRRRNAPTTCTTCHR